MNGVIEKIRVSFWAASIAIVGAVEAGSISLFKDKVTNTVHTEFLLANGGKVKYNFKNRGSAFNVSTTSSAISYDLLGDESTFYSTNNDASSQTTIGVPFIEPAISVDSEQYSDYDPFPTDFHFSDLVRGVNVRSTSSLKWTFRVKDGPVSVRNGGLKGGEIGSISFVTLRNLSTNSTLIDWNAEMRLDSPLSLSPDSVYQLSMRTSEFNGDDDEETDAWISFKVSDSFVRRVPSNTNALVSLSLSLLVLLATSNHQRSRLKRLG